MTDVKRLLAEATPLPWYCEKGDHLISARVGAEGHRRGVGDYAIGYFDNDPRTEDQGSADADAELIVAAVNHLPDYLAAVEALERARGEMYLPAHTHPRADESCVGCDLLQRLSGTTLTASAALARLREKVPA